MHACIDHVQIVLLASFSLANLICSVETLVEDIKPLGGPIRVWAVAYRRQIEAGVPVVVTCLPWALNPLAALTDPSISFQGPSGMRMGAGGMSKADFGTGIAAVTILSALRCHLRLDCCQARQMCQDLHIMGVHESKNPC